MKALVVLSMLVLSSISYANGSSCQPEAQIIAKVAAVEAVSIDDCVVSISADSITQYNPSQSCSLELDEVLSSNISVGLVFGHDCRLRAGDQMSGVLVKNASGYIYLE